MTSTKVYGLNKVVTWKKNSVTIELLELNRAWLLKLDRLDLGTIFYFHLSSTSSNEIECVSITYLLYQRWRRRFTRRNESEKYKIRVTDFVQYACIIWNNKWFDVFFMIRDLVIITLL